MIDINRPVRTRDGREVLGIRYGHASAPIFGFIVNKTCRWRAHWRKDGTYIGDQYGARHEQCDLVNIEVQP